MSERRAPEWLKRRYWRRRQLGTFVRGDGVGAATRGAVEATYLDLIDALEKSFARRPYVLGERPVEADFGLFGSVFRDFGCDPAPARVMRALSSRLITVASPPAQPEAAPSELRIVSVCAAPAPA